MGLPSRARPNRYRTSERSYQRLFICHFRNFIPTVGPHPDIQKLLKRPDASWGGAMVRPGRKQIGWILFEMPSKRFPRVLLRLPAYVSEEAMAMSHIAETDFASPWNPLNNDYYRHPEEAFHYGDGQQNGSKMAGFMGKSKCD